MWLFTAIAFAMPPGELIDCVRDDAQAIEVDGNWFALGRASFATSVVSFAPGPGVGPEYAQASTALGVPDWIEGRGAVSLGDPGGGAATLVVRFDHATLFDRPGADLYIFEVGPSVEATQVSVSDDGVNWVSVGRIEGATRAIDLAGRMPASGRVQQVRLQAADRAVRGAPYAGPDIDAVGAMGACPVRRTD